MDKKTESSFGQEIEAFIQGIDGLAIALPLSMLMIQTLNNQLHKDVSDFEQEHCKEPDSSHEYILVEADHFEQYRRLTRRASKVARANRLVPRSYVVALVSQFDAYLGSLMRNLFIIKPELLNASEKTISFSQLFSFGSVDDAKEHLIEKEIETVLRKSHTEQFDWLENRLGIPLRKDLSIWSTFIEVTERRNLC